MISQVEKSTRGWEEYRSGHKLFDGRLVLHTGANTATLEEVLAAPVPEGTDTWKPIGHGVILQETIESMNRLGLRVEDAAYSLTKGGNRFFGLLEMAGENKNGYGLIVGLRNSVDKTFPASVCTGSRVFVCDNLAFSAEVVIKRRHTAHILRDLPACVARAIGQIGELAQRQEKRLEAYKATKLSSQEVNDFLVKSIQNKALPGSLIMAVREQFDNPKHEEHNEHGDSAWKLFNGYTEALKGGLIQLPKRTQILHGMLDTLCGVQYGEEPTGKVEFGQVPVEAN